MAGQTLSLTIASGLQNAGFQEAAASVRGLGQEADGLAAGLNKSFDSMTDIKNLIPAMGLAEFLKLVNEQALNAEEAQVRLRTQVESSGTDWEKNKGQILGNIDAMAGVSRFAKDDLTTALTGLIQRTHDVGMAQRDLQLAMGLVVEAGGSLQQRIEDIGIVAEGGLPAQRKMLVLQREFGITATDNVDLLNKLSVTAHKALVEDMGSDMETQAQFWNDLKKNSTEFGHDLLPVWNVLLQVTEALGVLLKDLAIGTNLLLKWTGIMPALTLATQGWGLILDGLGFSIGKTSAATKKAGAEILNTTGALGKAGAEDIVDLTKALDELGKKSRDIGTKGILDPNKRIKAEVDQITAELMKLPGAQAHAEEIRVAVARYAAAERGAIAAEEGKKVETAMAELSKKTLAITRKESTDRKAAETDEVNAMIAEFKKLGPTNEQLQAYITQAWKYGDAQREQDTKADLKKMATEYASYGKEVTKYLTAVLTNNKAAQQQALIDDVNAVASAAQGKILMHYAEGAAKEVSDKGWAGVVSGLALMAEGIAAASAVGALASGVTSAISGGGTSSASGSGLAGSAGGGGGASASGGAAAAPAQQGVVVNVTGPVIGEQSFVNDMARRISDTVQSNNITFNVPAAKA